MISSSSSVGHAPVEHRHARFGTLFADSPRTSRRGLELGFLRLLDERIDDVRLPARSISALDELIDAPRRGPDAPRLDRCRPGGISSSTLRSRSPYNVSDSVRGIGVAVITRMSGESPFAPSALPLLNAESMLLVDDRETEACVNDVVFWMSAWVPTTSWARRSRSRQQRCAARSRGQAPGDHMARCRAARAVVRCVRVVLLGEDLRRRHQRGLVAVVDGDERREHATIVLPLPTRPGAAVHRLVGLQVARDFSDHPLLRVRQSERQDPLDLGAHGVVEHDLPRLRHHFFAGAAHAQRELQREELLQDDADVRARTASEECLVELWWMVDLFQRRREIDNAEALAQGGIERVLDGWKRRQRARNDLPQRFRRDVAHLRIWNDGAVGFVVAFEFFNPRSRLGADRMPRVSESRTRPAGRRA